MISKKPSLTAVQLVLMAVGSALVFPITFMPILLAPPANQDVWIAMLLGIAYGAVLFAPMLFLMIVLRGRTFNQMLEAVLGRVLGKILTVPFILFFVFCFTFCTLITSQFIQIHIMTRTPTWALALLIILPASYAAYKGAGTIGRLAVFIVPVMILILVLFFLLALPEMDWSVLRPVLADSTFGEINLGAFLTASRFSEVLILMVFSFHLNRQYSLPKVYLASAGVFAGCYLLILLPTLLILGLDLAKHAWGPYYLAVNHVEAFQFLENIQAFNTLAWFPTSILKMTLYLYMATAVTSGLVKARKHYYFILPFSALALIACLLPILDNSLTTVILRSDRVFPFIILPVTVVLPLLVLIVYAFRRKRLPPIPNMEGNIDSQA